MDEHNQEAVGGRTEAPVGSSYNSSFVRMETIEDLLNELLLRHCSRGEE